MTRPVVVFGARVAGIGGLIALVGGCSGDSLTYPTQPITCSFSTPAQLSGAPTLTLNVADMRLALEDLTARVVPSFSAGGELRDRLTRLTDAVGQPGTLAQCLGVEAARRALAALPSTPETAADRVVVELTLDMVVASLANVSP